MNPTCSVLIACYNARRTLRRAVESALAQGRCVKEVIVIDDASTDHSTRALERIRDERLRILRHPENRGQGAALNTGLDGAQGDFVLELDADDWLPPRSAARLLRAASRRSSATVGLYGDRRIWRPGARSLRQQQMWKGFPFRERYQFVLRSRRLPPGPRFLNRKALVEAGGWPMDDPTRGRLYADLLVWLRLLGIGDLHYLPATVYCVRRRRGSLSRANRRSWPLLRDLAIARAAAAWKSPLQPVFGRRGLMGYSLARETGGDSPPVEVHVEILPAPAGALSHAGDTRASLALQTLRPASIHERAHPSVAAPSRGSEDSARPPRFLLTVQAGVWLAPTALARLVALCPPGGSVAPRLVILGPGARSPFAHRTTTADARACALHSLSGAPLAGGYERPAGAARALRRRTPAGQPPLGGITFG